MCRNFAWVSESAVGANDAHPWVECSNKGTCDRSTGYVYCVYEACLYIYVYIAANDLTVINFD